MADPNKVVDVAVAAAKAAALVVPKTVEQIDKFGADVVKTVRLLTFPFQISGALQARLESYIEGAILQVPEERRIEPVESVAYPIVEKLRFQTEHDPITKLYIQLLSRAMDRELVGDVHPAFFNIITQMAPDELIFLQDFASRDETLIMSPTGQKVYPDPARRRARLDRSKMSADIRREVEDRTFSYEALSQPEFFPVYLEHLQHLGLIEYCGNSAYHPPLELRQSDDYELSVSLMKITNFGSMFLRACTKGNYGSAASTDTSNGWKS